MLHLPVKPAFAENNLAITLETSDYFTPYTSVTILSIMEHASPEYNYDFIVFSWDMSDENAENLVAMANDRENVSIRVIDISNKVRYYQDIVKQRKDYERFSAAGLVRLLFHELLEDYDVVLNFDCDMVICADVSELFQYDLTDYYMGAVRDMVIYSIAKNNPKDVYTNNLVFNELKLPSLEEYINGGLLLLNLKKIRADYTQRDIIDYAKADGYFYRCYEQDAFNGLFSGHKLFLPPEWNFFVDAANLISGSKGRVSRYDKYLKEYYEAENHIKNYHFLTKFKPWSEAEKVPYANEWWKVALKTPFIDETMRRIVKNTNVKTEEKRLLFFCETPYQLMSILNLKNHYYPKCTADLILTKTTDVGCYKEKLENLNIFEEIYLSNYDGKVDGRKVLREYSIEERTLYPEKYEYMFSFDKKYTDYFIPTCMHPFQQMIYYALINSGNVMNVFIYEEGATTYVDNIYVEINKFMKHSLYVKDKQLPENIKAIFMYRPDLYCGKSDSKKLPLIQMTEASQEYINSLQNLFGRIALPTEKYLFFDEPFAAEGLVSNHIQILEKIAEVVGKKNIAVKMHPRSRFGEEIYKLHGFKIFSDSSTPWEMAAFEPEIGEKIVLSVTSNVIWTPYLIFKGKNKNFAISLAKIMILSRRIHARVPEYWKLLSAVCNDTNKKKKRFYMPNSIHELVDDLLFIEGEM